LTVHFTFSSTSSRWSVPERVGLIGVCHIEGKGLMGRRHITWEGFIGVCHIDREGLIGRGLVWVLWVLLGVIGRVSLEGIIIGIRGGL
jgi:hypothetical protein